MLALEMKNWVICGKSIQQSLDSCVKREEEGKTAQQMMGNMRVKTLNEAAKVLCDVPKYPEIHSPTRRPDRLAPATRCLLLQTLGSRQHMDERLEEIGGDARTVKTMTIGALHQVLHLHNSLQHFVYICRFMYMNICISIYIHVYVCVRRDCVSLLSAFCT